MASPSNEPPALSLPAELWLQIIDLAADEDLIFQYTLPNTMAESAWYQKPTDGEWTLRTPHDALVLLQQRSYATKKAIQLTCKLFYNIVSPTLFRYLFINYPTRLFSLCRLLDSSSAPSSNTSSKSQSSGWWTRRLHLTRFHASQSNNTTLSDTELALTSTIRHCPNLQIFIVDWPLGDSFGPIIDTLATYTWKSLRTISWIAPYTEMSKVIWALDSLPFVVSAQVQVEAPHGEREAEALSDVNLGAAGGLGLVLPCLAQLALKGYIGEILEQAAGWSLPALRALSIETHDPVDALPFLSLHGIELRFLDLHTPEVDLSKVLDVCPLVNTLAFNADWRLPPDPSDTAAVIVSTPHRHIRNIGLHGLGHAFATWPTVVRRWNDLNIAALNKTNFPSLQLVRVLSQTVLLDLNASDGPGEEGGGWERWERWWAAFSSASIRLEDCTGEALGTLPPSSSDGSDSESEGASGEEWEEDEEYDSKWEFGRTPMGDQERRGHMSELRMLLEECRAMSEEREESLFFPFGVGGGMMGMGMGGGMGMGMGGMGTGMGMGVGSSYGMANAAASGSGGAGGGGGGNGSSGASGRGGGGRGGFGIA
ncbi:hypothetical protein BDQ17DRAFT_1401683 [Cyathus striatus]|nr:hypothetical protein BDQ17DRAFT_1401683 [Cyathus striatus]